MDVSSPSDRSETATDKREGSTERPQLVFQTGHTTKVDGIAFSQDGRWLATGSLDNTVKLWDADAGRELRTLKGHTNGVTTVSFAPAGGILASGSNDRTIKLWDTATGREAHTLRGHSNSIKSVAFSPDGRWLASGSADNTVKLWDVATGREVRTLAGHNGWVLIVAFSPDGRWLASGSLDKTVRLWESATGSERHTLTAHTDRIASVAFSPDSGWLASGSNDTTINLWKADTGRKINTLTGHVGKVLSVAFTPDGRRLISASADKTVKLWDIAAGRELHSLTDRTELEFESIACSPDGRRVASSTGDKTVEIREVATWRKLQTLDSRTSGVYATSFSPDNRWFASGNKDNTIKIWEAATGRELHTLKGHTSWVTTISFSPDNRRLASGSMDGTVRLWDFAAGVEARSFTGHTDNVYAIAFSPDGQWLASASMDKTVKLWDVSAGRGPERTLAGHAGEVACVAFSPDGQWLASGGGDKTIKVWDVASGRVVQTLAQHSGVVYGIAFSPDGKWLASGSADRTIKLWDVATGRDVRTLTGHTGNVNAVSISPDGQWLASAGNDRTVHLWNVATGRDVRTLIGHSDNVNTLAFNASGRWLASGSEDGSTRLWNIETGDLIATLASLSGSDDWLVVTPDGLFDGSPAAWNQILWRFSQDTFKVAPVEAFFSEFFYPGLLADILGGKGPRATQDISRRDRRQPQVKLTLADEGASAGNMTTRRVKVKIEVAEAPAGEGRAAGSGARDVRLFRNGILVQAWRGDVLRDNTGRVVIETTLPVVSGANELTAYAFNSDNVKSSDARLILGGAESLKRAGTAYILAVGVNQYENPEFNLRYAVADARVFAEEVRHQQAKLSAFARIEVIPLLDREATKANIIDALRRLAGTAPKGPASPGTAPVLEKITPVQPEDAVVIYFAGHGLAQQQRFYLIPHDLGYHGQRARMDEEGLKTMLAHSISDRELEQSLEGLDAGTLLLVIDACNSGQALEAEEKRRGPMNSKGLAQLAYEKGMYLLTAAQSYQAALEVAELGHGLLTYALIEQGLKQGAADFEPKDSQVRLREWLDYATARVPAMQVEKMKLKRGLGIELAFVEGEEKEGNLEKRSLQRPRVFYRREVEARDLIVTQLESSNSGK